MMHREGPASCLHLGMKGGPGNSPNGGRGPHIRDGEEEVGPVTQASPLIMESVVDESGSEEEVARCKKRHKTLKSGKVRTADSTVVKRIT